MNNLTSTEWQLILENENIEKFEKAIHSLNHSEQKVFINFFMFFFFSIFQLHSSQKQLMLLKIGKGDHLKMLKIDDEELRFFFLQK